MLLKDGDQAAFEAIYYRYWKRMLALAFTQLKQYQQAEDIVQDIFTALWARRTIQHISSLENWLATAVKFKVINLINRQLKREIASENLPDTPITDASTEQRFLEKEIAATLEQLPEKSKIIFHYSRNLGYSNKEIGKQLNIAEKTVEKHITSARKHLSLSLRNLLHSLFSLL